MGDYKDEGPGEAPRGLDEDGPGDEAYVAD